MSIANPTSLSSYAIISTRNNEVLTVKQTYHCRNDSQQEAMCVDGKSSTPEQNIFALYM
jgi:hypothetical protein